MPWQKALYGLLSHWENSKGKNKKCVQAAKLNFKEICIQLQMCFSYDFTEK